VPAPRSRLFAGWTPSLAPHTPRTPGYSLRPGRRPEPPSKSRPADTRRLSTPPCSRPGSGSTRAEVVEDVDVVVAMALAGYPLAGLPEPDGLAADADEITDFVKGGAGVDADRAPPGRRRQLPIRFSPRQGSSVQMNAPSTSGCSSEMPAYFHYARCLVATAAPCQSRRAGCQDSVRAPEKS